MANVLLFLVFIKVMDIFVVNFENFDIYNIFLTFLMLYLHDLFQIPLKLFIISVVKIFILIKSLTMITIPFIIQNFLNAMLIVLFLGA